MDYGGTLGFNLGVEDPNCEVGNSRVKNKISQKKNNNNNCLSWKREEPSL